MSRRQSGSGLLLRHYVKTCFTLLLLCCKCFVYFEECSVVSDQSLNNNI